jgi:hypothetical protein
MFDSTSPNPTNICVAIFASCLLFLDGSNIAGYCVIVVLLIFSDQCAKLQSQAPTAVRSLIHATSTHAALCARTL